MSQYQHISILNFQGALKKLQFQTLNSLWGVNSNNNRILETDFTS